MGRALFDAWWANLQFSSITDNFLGIVHSSHIMGHFHIERLALSCLKKTYVSTYFHKSKETW